ncbi:unnamed protein product [Linum trigynum]|uniref:Uncharacterized protein n=1 Tax=Linum trigynum TaxID=586398 RepID=A0AAV2E3N4_9ROSI
MVSTKSMKAAAEKAAQATEKGTDAGDVGLDGELEDLTEIEGLRKVVETQAERQSRIKEELNGLQVQARDHGRTLDALLAAVEALQGQVSSLTEAWKRGGAADGDGEKPPEEKGAAEESASVAAVGGQGAEKGSADGGAAASNPSRPPVSRSGQVSFGPTIKDGLLPTPSAQELARARGKAKMAEYVDPGSHTGLNLEELVDPEQERDRGPWPNEQRGLGADGWREEGGPIGRAQWEGGPGGGWRESGRRREPGRSGATGRDQPGRGDLGRAGMGRVSSVRAEFGRTETGRTEAGRAKPGRTETGRNRNRSDPGRTGPAGWVSESGGQQVLPGPARPVRRVLWPLSFFCIPAGRREGIQEDVGGGSKAEGRVKRKGRGPGG